MSTLTEQRKVPRVEFQARVEIDRLSPQARLEASSMNLSEGGICVRLQEMLEVRSRVRLRVFTEPSKRPLQCLGQVAWVVQRLDLRTAPPFLYDVGLEFLESSPRLRQLASHAGLIVKPLSEPHAPTPTGLQPITLHGRTYVPWLQREAGGAVPWHLVVRVDGIPCFSHRYPSHRDALAAWVRFKRRPMNPVTSSASPVRRPASREVLG